MTIRIPKQMLRSAPHDIFFFEITQEFSNRCSTNAQGFLPISAGWVVTVGLRFRLIRPQGMEANPE